MVKERRERKLKLANEETEKALRDLGEAWLRNRNERPRPNPTRRQKPSRQKELRELVIASPKVSYRTFWIQRLHRGADFLARPLWLQRSECRAQ